MSDEPTTPPTSPPTETPATTEQVQTPSPTETKTEEKPSLLNDKPKDEPKAGAPEKYSDFTLPEGFELTEEASKEAGELFKSMNLTQADAQRLVDFHAKSTQDAANAPVKYWQDMQDQWQKEIKADPEIGGKLDSVRSTVSKAIDTVLGPKLSQDFRQAMDLTGAGNNPAFIKGFYKFASLLTEGGHVAAGGPAPVRPTGKPASAAQAMYPNLPSGG